MAAKRTTHTTTPDTRDFLQKFGNAAWAWGLENGIGAEAHPYWAGAEQCWAGLEPAFEVVFGRVMNTTERDLLTLFYLEREHDHLTRRGRDRNGFDYYEWNPEVNKKLNKYRERLARRGVTPLDAAH